MNGKLDMVGINPDKLPMAMRCTDSWVAAKHLQDASLLVFMRFWTYACNSYVRIITAAQINEPYERAIESGSTKLNACMSRMLTEKLSHNLSSHESAAFTHA